MPGDPSPRQSPSLDSNQEVEESRIPDTDYSLEARQRRQPQMWKKLPRSPRCPTKLEAQPVHGEVMVANMQGTRPLFFKTYLPKARWLERGKLTSPVGSGAASFGCARIKRTHRGR